MLQNSYISDSKISKSMTRLNKISSDRKFRVNSLRVKTQQKLSIFQSPIKKSINFPSLPKTKALSSSTSIKKLSPHLTSTSNVELQNYLLNKKIRVKTTYLQKDYESELLNKLKLSRQIVQQLFTLKLQNEQIKPTEDKFLQFCKNMYNRLFQKVEISVEGFNFKTKALEKFLNFFIQWKQKDIIGIDLSFCSELAHQVKTKQEQIEEVIRQHNGSTISQHDTVEPLWPKNSIVTRLVLQDSRLLKIAVRNMSINPEQMIDLLTCCLKSKRIYSVDISNKNSQTINRLGNDYYYLEAFFGKNQYVGVMKMDNLNVTDECIQRISAGVMKNIANNPLKILSLSSNLLTQKSLNSIYNLFKSGITELNLSSNMLGFDFFMNMKNLRGSTVKNLDLTSTGMNSESLINFLEQISQSKSLQILKLDNNDFSHHWFNKIKDVFESGFSVQSISFVNCSIKNFDTLFQGLFHSKSLKKLNLNYNLVDIQNQNIEKIEQCLKLNKYLQQLKIRFCGYNQPILLRLIQAIRSNKSLQIIDISENHLSDEGGKNILKILNQNKYIKLFGIEKLQFTVRMTQDIEKLLKYNKDVREKQEIIKLIDQNKIYKAKDTLSWNDIYSLQSQAKKLEDSITNVKQKKVKIEQKIEKRKQFILGMRRQFKQQQKKLDRQIKKQQQQVAFRLRKINDQIVRVTQFQNTAVQSLQIEQNLIKALQNKILKENEKIKKRQNQLQNQLRDEKYMQRKKQKQSKEIQKPQVKKGSIKQQKQKSGRIFDNTKGKVNTSKRKTSTPTITKK